MKLIALESKKLCLKCSIDFWCLFLKRTFLSHNLHNTVVKQLFITGWFFFNVDRKDAEGWETVQRGRPVRSRSMALSTKPVVAESLKPRGDSDKENVISPPSESKSRSSVSDDGASKSTELAQKDPLHQSEHPLTERTQVSKILNHFLALRSLAALSLENFLKVVLSRVRIH